MSTFGPTDPTGSSPYNFWAITTASIQAAAYRYTAVAGDVVTGFSVFGQSPGGTGTIKAAVYVYDSGTDKPTTRVGTGIVTLNVDGTSTWSSVSGLNIPLSAGTTYVVCLGESSSDNNYVNLIAGTGNEKSANNSSGVLADPWVHETYSASRFMAYATVTNGGGGTAYSYTLDPFSISADIQSSSADMVEDLAPFTVNATIQDLTVNTVLSGGTLQASVKLVTSSTDSTPLANLSGLKWIWWDSTDVATIATSLASDYGLSGTTDGSGIMTVNLPNSTLTAGQAGTLLITNTNGLVTQNPPPKSYFAPTLAS